MATVEEPLADLGLIGRRELSADQADSGLLPSPLRVTECAVSAVAACLAAAAELTLVRTGRRPEVTLDAGHVAAAFRSEVWLHDQAGQGIKDFASLSRLWRAADGWVRTHANYPWHRSALLACFGVPDGLDSDVEPVLATTFAGLAGSEIEERAYSSGALAVTARTVEEWRTSEANATRATRLVSMGTLGSDAPPLARPGSRPASGVRVLDFTRVIAGPVGTRMLGALGAEVLRIDDPRRPELPLPAVDGVIGKASTTLNATTRVGQEIVEGLLGQADVLVTAYRPGALRRLGLEADQVAERHPHLAVVSLSAWGPGLWETRRGFDSLVQIASGIGWASSPDGERPGALPCQLLDHATGYLVAASALAALTRRARTGQVAHVRLSLARTAKWLLDQPRHDPSETGGSPQVEEEVRPYRVPLGDGWSGIAPPGRLDDHPLSWPHLPARYGADPPAWTDGQQ